MKRIKVLIVDDSAVVRQSLQSLLESDSAIEVIGTAADPYQAATKIERQVPDVITLDVEMPRMDGLTFLRKLMSQHPIPVVICSSLTDKGSETALKALEYGAVGVTYKPRYGAKDFLEEERTRFCDLVKGAAQAKLKRLNELQFRPIQPKLSADAVLPMPSAKAMIRSTEKIIAIGASTGGTEALKVLLEALPHDSPALVVVQHMPEKFTAAFAERLNQSCQIDVKEAADNDSLVRGRALIAPGNQHLLVKRSGARYFVQTREGPLVSRHRPSVDVLFRSAARYGGSNVIGVLLTGMGDDGAKGLLELRQAGAATIAESEESCVVFGMPKEAIKLGAAAQILSLDKIALEVLKLGNRDQDDQTEHRKLSN